MRLNIGQKILGIALVVLTMMIIVAGHSIWLTSNIADDLTSVTKRQIPVSEAVARIDLRILEQGLLLQRLFVLTAEGESDAKATERHRQTFDDLGQEVAREFQSALALLAAPGKLGRHSREAKVVLAQDLKKVEEAYDAFEHHGRDMLSIRAGGDPKNFEALLQPLDARQDAVNRETGELRRHAEELTSTAVERADRDEQYLLISNSVLTALAVVLAVIFASLVTRTLVRAVRNLVDGAERVEAGDLDVEVQATSIDEVGDLTVSFNTMVDGLRMKDRIKDTFGKYMDPRIVSNLLENPEFAEPGGERREMTVMFIDLKGFTSISEALPPDDLVRMINRFFEHMTDAIADNKGVVDKFMGDAVMAYWGPPFTAPDEHAPLACRAALEALEHLERFREDVRQELGDAAENLDIDLRIGVSTGEMIVGTVGSRVSMNFTIMGDPVNLGSRLEGANKNYGTRAMISERTQELAGNTVHSRELDLIRVKGKANPTRVYELVAPSVNQADLDAFNIGLIAYRKRDWDTAETAFRSCLEKDPAAATYLDRVIHFRDDPPAEDWDGVWVFTNK